MYDLVWIKETGRKMFLKSAEKSVPCRYKYVNNRSFRNKLGHSP